MRKTKKKFGTSPKFLYLERNKLGCILRICL